MTTPATQPRPARNGVNVPVLFATVDAVNAQKELAKFQFRATNKWISGTYSQSRIDGFFGAGQEHTRSKSFLYEGDHPTVLVGPEGGWSPEERAAAGAAGAPSVAVSPHVLRAETAAVTVGAILTGIRAALVREAPTA